LKAMRQSTTKNADICLKRLAYDLDPSVPRGQSAARAIGTAYHASLEALYNGDAWWKDHGLTELRTQYSNWPHLQEDIDHGMALIHLTDMFNAYQQWDPKAWEVVATEAEWFLPLHGEWVIKGAIDLVLRSKLDGQIHLADHKTAGKAWPKDKGNPRKDVQPSLYTYAWWQLTGERPAGWSYDVMTYKGNFERRYYDITDAHMTLALQKSSDVAVLLERMPLSCLPANPSSNLCSEKYCDFWNVCPFGAASAA
jgi:hypothetical protein